MGRIPPAYNQNDWPLELGRLVALAERFASEGQMNLNKLVEAAVYVQAPPRWLAFSSAGHSRDRQP